MTKEPPIPLPQYVTLYRVVSADPPVPSDFFSLRALGVSLQHRTAKGLRLWDGLSVYRKHEQAAGLASRSPRLGRFVAELRVPTNGTVRLELDNGKDGHCTIWGQPEALIAYVASVSPA